VVSAPLRPRAEPSTEALPLPEFGSPEHLEQRARRLAKNLKFKDDVLRWTRLSLEYRAPVCGFRP
jgi:hypothetical protein